MREVLGMMGDGSVLEEARSILERLWFQKGLR